ncbi:hypothetical protein OCU04_003432 [Sclerotinia nivalis]|uniref:Uncharacterized protein n=1 Tax=Sclerotinia nivalis TaxID=352851 RepID=A0A9X0ASU9_9HELO|nr:hypothetical protein OCU04_003432 [Sclerotinia nivalis]
MFQKLLIFVSFCNFLAYFRNDFLASAYIPPPLSLGLHTLPHPSKSLHSSPSPSHLPRTIAATFPPCFPAAATPKYAPLCTLWFTASTSTPTNSNNPNPLTLTIFGPSCSPPLLTLTSLPLDKNISINTESTPLLGNLSIQVANGSWYNEIWYRNKLVDFQLSVDERGIPYYPDDFGGRVVRWTGFECAVRRCEEDVGGRESADCDAGKGVAMVDGVVHGG